MCAGNTIKTSTGNAKDCDADAQCDGVKNVPNENHTYCGKFICSEFKKGKKVITN